MLFNIDLYKIHQTLEEQNVYHRMTLQIFVFMGRFTPQVQQIHSRRTYEKIQMPAFNWHLLAARRQSFKRVSNKFNPKLIKEFLEWGRTR